MSKIDISNWGEFKVGDLFTQERGKEKAPKQNKEGTCKLISETSINNGFDRYVKPTKKFKGNAITVSVNYASTVLYQPEEFCASVNILILYNKNMNQYSGLFIAGILSQVHKKYDYTNKISKDLLNNEIIKLPITQTGEPDYDYMEEYMKKIETAVSSSLTKMRSAQSREKRKIDVREWGEFKVGELFDIHLSKDDIQPKNIIEGSIPLVSSGKTNNGIISYINDENAKIWNGNVLTVDMFGKAFYQPKSFHCVSHGRVNILIPKEDFSKYVLQFLSVLIERIAEKYEFNEMCTSKKISQDKIYLPITSSGDPDWTYMENYMREIEKKVEKKIERIS